MVNSEYIKSINKAFIASEDLKRFDDRDVKVVSDKVVDIRRRRFSGFIYWLDNPQLKDTEIVNFIMELFGVSRAQAYRDLQTIKAGVGNIKGTDKQFIRVELYEKMKALSDLAEGKGNYKQAIAAWAVIGKFCGLDKEDLEDIPWNEIIPPDFEPDADVSLIDLKPIENLEEFKAKMRKKYMSNTEDIEFEELDDE